jgi:hypothetical protein
MKNHAGVPFSSLNCFIIKIIFGILLVFGSLATILSEILASSRPPFETLTVLCKLFKIERILMLKILPSLFSPTFIKTFLLIKISSILHLYYSASPPPTHSLTRWLMSKTLYIVVHFPCEASTRYNCCVAKGTNRRAKRFSLLNPRINNATQNWLRPRSFKFKVTMPQNYQNYMYMFS